MVVAVFSEVMYIIWFVLLEDVVRYVSINHQSNWEDTVYYRRPENVISILLIKNLGTN
jgi:hypothetical protein